MDKIAILGIDVSKDFFDVSLMRDGKIVASGQFNNSSAGFKSLQSWLKKRKVSVTWSCMEATGRYGDELAHFLYERGHQVSVVNPARIKRYMQSKLQRNKSDQLDARLIADFCATQKPDLWSPPPLEIRQLQEMVRRLGALKDERTRESNRL